MEEGLKYVGAGLATLAMFGAALGVGNIFSSYLDAAMRNPSAAPQQQGNLPGFRTCRSTGHLRVPDCIDPAVRRLIFL